CMLNCCICLHIQVSFKFFIFFFSSRRRHTRFSRDWSSDVCFPIFLYFCSINRREMKLNTLFVVGVCATTLFMSCGSETAQEKQLRLTHTTLVDGDTYQFFQLVGAKVIYEKDYASYVAGVANS